MYVLHKLGLTREREKRRNLIRERKMFIKDKT